MEQFIQVTDNHGPGVKHYINVRHIVRVVSSSTPDWNGCTVTMVDNKQVFVTELYDTVLSMIQGVYR